MLPTITNGQLFVEHCFPELFCAFSLRSSRITTTHHVAAILKSHFLCNTFIAVLLISFQQLSEPRFWRGPNQRYPMKTTLCRLAQWSTYLKFWEPLKERLMKKKLLNSKPQPMELKISVRWSLTSKKLISWRVKKAKVSWKSGSVTGMSFGKMKRGKKSAKPRRNVDYCYFKLSSLDRLQANSGIYSI